MVYIHWITATTIWQGGSSPPPRLKTSYPYVGLPWQDCHNDYLWTRADPRRNLKNPWKSQLISNMYSTLFVGYFDEPPSSSISTKYNAPLSPHGSWDTSTSKVNSLMVMAIMMTNDDEQDDDHRPVLEVEHVVVLLVRCEQVSPWTNVATVSHKLKVWWSWWWWLWWWERWRCRWLCLWWWRA